MEKWKFCVKVPGLGFRAWGLEFRVSGFGFRVEGMGFRVVGDEEVLR